MVRSTVYEALDLVEADSVERAQLKLCEAREMLTDVHAKHLELVKQEASGESVPVTLLLVHAEDVLMAVSSELNLVEKFLDIFERRTSLASQNK